MVPGGETGCSCHPSVINQSPLAVSEIVSRGQSGHVWFQPCILTRKEESPLWTLEECVPDNLHSVYRCTICFRCRCSGMHNNYVRDCTITQSHTAWLDVCTHVFPTWICHFSLLCHCANKQILFALQTSTTSARWSQVCRRKTYARKTDSASGKQVFKWRERTPTALDLWYSRILVPRAVTYFVESNSQQNNCT